jgi:predicted ATPase
MILNKIDYQEFEGESNSWSLKNVELEKINLFVGKNATGKTRTINAISHIGNLLAWSFSWLKLSLTRIQSVSYRPARP